MSAPPATPRRIWLRSFYGFTPEEDGYIGWTEEGPRDRMLSLVEDGDLFLIYGAASAETARVQRSRVMGFLQVDKEAIRDTDKSSAIGMKRKLDAGWRDKWSYAIPVRRAWRAEESILLEQIAFKTYRAEAGQAIAVWNPPLLPEEIEQALRIKVSEVNVFGEPPIEPAETKKAPLREVFTPSRAFPGSFGESTVNREDGPTFLYLMRFEGDGRALLGQSHIQNDKRVLMKIGVSSDLARRVAELNSGFPPAALGKWTPALKSKAFPDRKSAENAEQIFKDTAVKELESVGGEFFLGNWRDAELVFARIPGVARFGA